jgi:SAM-dependent methyltransferase
VIDLGAGRGEWTEDPVDFRRDLRNLQGKVAEVIGVDIDPAVALNPAIDRSEIMADFTTIPLDDSSVDMIVCDHTFEHVDNPEGLVRSMHRVLRPGGWICARTPNRWGYIGLAANAVPNRFHVRVLEWAQPTRQEQDVFPTRYKMNSKHQLRRLFPDKNWELYAYTFNPEPSYFGKSRRLKDRKSVV